MDECHPGLPKNAWVSSVEPGHFADGTVYATFDLHTFGDMRPYSYKSTDFGKTWTPIVSSDAGVRGYAHVIKEDLVNKDLLFLGTEFGLWVSLDGGARWARYKGGDMPAVAVRDLAIHPRDNDLIIATHGRGIWIIDDITPLRGLTTEVLSRPVAFMKARPTVQRIGAFGGWVNGDAAFVGPNPTDDAVITYYLQKRHIFGEMKLEVLDSEGEVVATLPSTKRRGLSRVTWSMRLKPPTVPAAASATGASVGPRLLPGSYTVRMTKDKEVYSMPLTVVPDSRTTHTLADRRAQFNLSKKLADMLGDMSVAVDRLNLVRLALDSRAQSLPAADPLITRLRSASSSVDALRKKIVATKEGGAITGEERLRENLADLYSSVNGYDGRPTQMELDRTEAIGRELANIVRDYNAWLARELPGINSALLAKKLETIAVPPEKK